MRNKILYISIFFAVVFFVSCRSRMITKEFIQFPYVKGREDIPYNESLKIWEEGKAKNGNSYIYQRSFVSWTGYGEATQITVENGKVTCRMHKTWEGRNNRSKICAAYKETGEEIGTHNNGYPAVTIDELYKAGYELLQADTTKNKIYFTTHPNGVLKFCGYYPKNCVDDCFNGIIVNGIKWIK